MKKSAILVAAAALMLSSCATTNIAGSGSPVNTGDLLSGVTGIMQGLLASTNLTERDLVGNWQYSSPAVAFQSNDIMKKAGGAAAAQIIENKIAPYYNKVGLRNLSATFMPDGTFAFRFHGITLEGAYEKNPENPNGGEFIFTFQAVKNVPIVAMRVNAERLGNRIALTVDGSDMVKIINKAAELSGQPTIQAAASLLNSYDGVNFGFYFQLVP